MSNILWNYYTAFWKKNIYNFVNEWNKSLQPKKLFFIFSFKISPTITYHIFMGFHTCLVKSSIHISREHLLKSTFKISLKSIIRYYSIVYYYILLYSRKFKRQSRCTKTLHTISVCLINILLFIIAPNKYYQKCERLLTRVAFSLFLA